MEPCPADAEETVRAILGYFLRHPHAADSVVGIADWRLLGHEGAHDPAATLLALRWLVRAGLVEEVAAPGMPSIYRLDRAQTSDAERWLVQHPTPKRSRV
jgi:hypothetical protein